MTLDVDPLRAIRRLNRLGIALIVVLVGGAGGWAATTQLSGAVVASGLIVVETNVKKVQHPNGGIVSEILINEGSLVEEGQIVMRLDDTLTRSTLGVARSQLDEATARHGRLIAERDGNDTITFADDLLARRDEKTVATAMAGEERLFLARRSSRVGQRAQLRERIAQTKEEVRGLSAQYDAKVGELKLIGEELVGVTDLYKKQLVSIIRYMQLKRDEARIEGERGNFIAEIARAKAKISETELQIIQLDQDYLTEVLKDLRDAQGKIAELSERVTGALDQLKRIDIRATQAGFVHQLSVHTVGGVISAGEVIMQIVPGSDKLIVEARVAPPDIDQVSVGATTMVRVMAGNQRITPEVMGIVTYISADLTREQQNNQQNSQTYFVVRVALSEDDVHRLGSLKLLPGMPAEIFIQTGERTPLQYLLKPLLEQIARTFRER